MNNSYSVMALLLAYHCRTTGMIFLDYIIGNRESPTRMTRDFSLALLRFATIMRINPCPIVLSSHP